MTLNIQLTICDAEDQVYTNKQHITVENIRNALMGAKLKPCVGNFPHVNGDFQLVEVTHVISTHREDNAGLDIADVISRDFVIVGRVSDEDNIMMFINAIDSDKAKEHFLEHVKVEQDWNGKQDIYIEFCMNLSSYKTNHVYTDIETSDVFCVSSV